MKKLYGLLILVLIAYYPVSAQEDQKTEEQNICTQNLRVARTLYEEGKLNDIPKTLNSCLENGFSTEERIEAYRLLAVTYLYLNEPDKADEAMLLLLKENPEYRVNNDLDPAEYINLYKSFRTTWLFRAGIKAGGIYSLPYVTEFRGTSLPGEYLRGLGFQLGIFGEFKINDLLFIQPEVQYTSRAYGYSNRNIGTSEIEINEPFPVGSYEASRTMNYVELLVAAKYQIWPLNAKGEDIKLSNGFIKAYATLAPGIGYLLSAYQNSTETQVPGGSEENPRFALNDPDIDLYNKINPQVFIGGGTEFKFGRVYINLDIRYGYSFQQLINSDNRYNLPNSINGISADSDHKLHSLSFSIGIMKAFYKPVKIRE